MQEFEIYRRVLVLSNRVFCVIIFAIWGKMGAGKINGDFFPFFMPQENAKHIFTEVQKGA